MKVLVTGAEGFIGSRIVPRLREDGHEVATPPLNLFDWQSLVDAVREERWDVVVHLAAISHVPTCQADPEAAYRTNLGGTATLVEALRKHAPSARIVFASTAQVYAGPSGDEVRDGVVFDEARRLVPQNVYARTKRAAEVVLDELAPAHTTLRLFNHTHKSQSPDFFLPHLYAALSRGEREIPVGNLDLVRDVGSVADLVDAFSIAVRMPLSGVFNVASGHGKHLRRVAETLAERLGVEARFVTDASRVRADEPVSIVGSHAKFSAATGWSPSCRTEHDLIDAFLA